MSEPDPARTPTEHSHEHEHGGSRIAGLRHRVGHVLVPHSHDAGDKVDAAMETSREGIRTLWISLATLGATVPGRWFIRHRHNAQVKAFVTDATAAAGGALTGAVVVLPRQAVTDLPSAAIALVTLGLLPRWP